MIIHRTAPFLAALFLLATPGYSQTPANKKDSMTSHASGTFEVKMTPQSADQGDDSAIGRFAIDKQFSGAIQGTSKGQMLGYRTPVDGSAGYVAMERVTGTLNGRSGSFVLQHSGSMNRGALELVLTVVPDSGAGQLVGLSGRMSIKIEPGKHFYEFDYTLPN